MQVGKEALVLFFHGDKMLSEQRSFRRSYYDECNYSKKLNKEI